MPFENCSEPRHTIANALFWAAPETCNDCQRRPWRWRTAPETRMIAKGAPFETVAKIGEFHIVTAYSMYTQCEFGTNASKHLKQPILHSEIFYFDNAINSQPKFRQRHQFPILVNSDKSDTLAQMREMRVIVLFGKHCQLSPIDKDP